MSYLDDASLVMIPSGYKDGKLYSVKPSDGAGDFTFTRGSNLAATRVDVNGLIEKGRENLLLQSNQFDTTWGGAASTLSGQSGYDGSSDAWLITKAGLFDSRRQVITNSGVATFSVYAKAGSYNWMLLHIEDAAGDCLANFDLSTGTLGTLTNGITSKIEDIGSGWYRCSATFNRNLSDVRIYPSESSGYTGSSGSIYIQDAQLEVGLVATDYIETGATTAQAGILEDMPRLDYSGGTCPALLLEPQRTNVLPQSEYFGGSEWTKTNTAVTTNAATSPEGVQNASLVYPTASSSTKWGVMIQEFLTGLVSANYINTFYLKSNGWRWVYIIDPSGAKNVWFDLQEGVVGTQEPNANGEIQAMGNGWYKCVVYPHTSPTTYVYSGVFFSDADNSYVCTASGTNGVYIYGAQCEAGSYPTSYIPTYGTSVTRGEDRCSKTGVSLLIGQSEGTLLLDLNPLQFDSDSRYLSIESASGAGSGWIGIFASPPDQFRIYGNGFDINISGYSVGDRAKIALTYKNGVATDIYINGVNKGSITANTTGKDYSILKIGKAVIGGIGAGEYKQVLVFPTALSDAQCIALTTL